MPGDTVLVTATPEAHGTLIQRLGAQGYFVLPIKTAREAFATLGTSTAACLAIFDVTLRRQHDFETIAHLTERNPALQIVLLSERTETRQVEVQFDKDRVHLLDTPLSHPRSARKIEHVLDGVSRTAELNVAADQAALKDVAREDVLLYSEEFLTRVGQANVPVLLHGETGVGKEVMARRLWACSPRATKPFLKLNCAALPSELIESELFGYEKGAFTGAAVDKPGRFEAAQGGTILLDEIGDMDIRLQAKLLHVLQDGEVQPLGSNRTIKVDVRVMSSTHRDLRNSIEEGTFREDLFYRLSVINIDIPPLRERRAEIIPLAEILLRRHVPPNTTPPALTPQLEKVMLDYGWPGNVRELENVMRRFLVYQDAGPIIHELTPKRHTARVKHATTKVPAEVASSTRPEVSTIDRLAEVSREAETRLLLDTLESTRWNRRQAAARLNIDYKAFLYKLQKHGIVETRVKR